MTASSQVCARCERSASRGRAGDVELGHDGADRVERAARLLDRRFEIVGAAAQHRHRLAGGHHHLAQRVELADVGVELRFAGRDRRAQLVDAAPRLVELRASAAARSSSSAPASSSRTHLDRQRARALDQRRVRRAGFGGAAAQILGRLARLEQPALGDGQPLVGLALRLVEPRDRRARLFLAAIERVALFFRLMLLARELLGLLRQPRLLVGRVLQLRVVADDRLLLLVVLGVERGDRVGRVRDGAPRAPPSPAPAASARSRSAAMRSRSSLISRLVSRMPRDSARPPPDTRCGPRNTSPSSVAIGSGVSRLAAAAPSYDCAIPASPIAWRIAAANGPLTRTTDDSATTPSGSRAPRGRMHVGGRQTGIAGDAHPRREEAGAAPALPPASVTRKPQRPAPASRTS